MVIVIGATSFIGMYTVDELVKSGKQVIATGRNERLRPFLESMGAEFVSLDITKPEDFSKLPVDNVDGVILWPDFFLPMRLQIWLTKRMRLITLR